MKFLFALLMTLVLVDPIPINLQKKKLGIDQYIAKYPKVLILFAKVPKKKELVRIKNEHWPDEVEYSYNVLKDETGKIIFVAKIPFSESGDWSIEYNQYFDEKGNTFAFTRETGFFNSECTDDAAHETISKYYDNNFKQIAQTYKLTDSKKKPLNKLKCTFPYDFKDYKIYSNVNECLKVYNIKL